MIFERMNVRISEKAVPVSTVTREGTSSDGTNTAIHIKYINESTAVIPSEIIVSESAVQSPDTD